VEKEMIKLHYKVYSMFCPRISITPSNDYSKVASKAVATYPGARSVEEALIFSNKHSEMSITNAKNEISNLFHEQDSKFYASGWVERYMRSLEEL
jgi:hypothetical protein